MCFVSPSDLQIFLPTSSTMAIALNPKAQDYLPTSLVPGAPLETYYCYSTPVSYSPYPLPFPEPFYFAPYHNKFSYVSSDQTQIIRYPELCYLSQGSFYYTSSSCPRKEYAYDTDISHMSILLPSCQPHHRAALAPFSVQEQEVKGEPVDSTSAISDCTKVSSESEDVVIKDSGGVSMENYTKCRPRKPVRRFGDGGTSTFGQRKMYLPRAANRRRASRRGGNTAELEFKVGESPATETGDEKTTVMIRNLPNSLTKKQLLEILDNHCFEENQRIKTQCLTNEGEAQGGDAVATLSQFNFLYLPVDFRTGNNMGYAFVNFTSAIGAWRLYYYLHNHSWKAYRSPKTCAITYARIQGLEALVKHFSSSTFLCNNDSFLPACFTPPRDGSCRVSQRLIGRRLPVAPRLGKY